MTNPRAAAVEVAEAAFLDHGQMALVLRHHGDVPRAAVRASITAYLAAMRAEGWVMVPREPTLEMLQDGYDAGRKAYHNGISGMTIDAQIRAQSHREAAIYRAMIEAAMLKGAGDEG